MLFIIERINKDINDIRLTIILFLDKSLKVEYNQYKTLGTHGNKDI